MQFSSRPPFNDDPEPYRAGRTRFDAMAGSLLAVKHSPRPEFNRPQHNPTNPILARFRRWIEGEDLADPYWIETFLHMIAREANGDYTAGGDIIFHAIEDAQGENPEGYGHAAAWNIEHERNTEARGWRGHACEVLRRLTNVTKES